MNYTGHRAETSKRTKTNLIDEGHDVGVLGRVEVDDVEAVTLADIVADAHERGRARLRHAVVDDDGVVFDCLLGLLRW